MLLIPRNLFNQILVMFWIFNQSIGTVISLGIFSIPFLIEFVKII